MPLNKETEPYLYMIVYNFLDDVYNYIIKMYNYNASYLVDNAYSSIIKMYIYNAFYLVDIYYHIKNIIIFIIWFMFILML